MIYNEQQFASFSTSLFKYEKQEVIATHTEIRTAITKFYNTQAVKDKFQLAELPAIDIFLQGSYANDTNISKSSDVDIVLRLQNVWRAYTTNLKSDELNRYKASTKDSLYTFNLYNLDILFCLQSHFGAQYIFNDDKCLKIKNHPKFCDADIVPALTYKFYNSFYNSENQKYDEGIIFDTNTGKQIVNFPKEHRQALILKNQATNGNFKESVRMFKTLKQKLIDNGKLHKETVKSYFLENLLFNIDNAKFTGSYKNRFESILEELVNKFNDKSITKFRCANGVHDLISEHVWNIESAKELLIGLVFIKNRNEF